MVKLERTLQGRILDIGGGGEGIIGRLYRDQVIAIDNRQEELDEAPDGFEKMLMDAAQLQFEDAAFDHVTFFFTLMFMDSATQQRAVAEAVRVLKPGAALHIWDCEIPSAYPEPFCINVDICLPEETLHTTYGIGKLDVQSAASIAAICKDAGLAEMMREQNGDCFHFVLKKEAFRMDGAMLGKCGFYCGGCPTYIKGNCSFEAVKVIVKTA